MEGLSEMSDQEIADWLRSYPREKSPEEVAAAEHRRDRERGEYGQQDHHEFGESRH